MAKYFKSKDYEVYSYDAVSDTPVTDEDWDDEVTWHRNARVVVKPPRETPLYGKDRWGKEDPAEDRLRMEMYNHHEDDIEEAVERHRETPQLFHHTPAEIDSAYSDPKMRIHMGTLLGMVMNDYKEDLRAPHSLSRHSSRLAQRGIASGVISSHPLNPAGEETNDEDFFPMLTGINKEGKLNIYSDSVEVPKAEVAAGRSTMHNLLGKKKLSPQFQALQKFEQDRDTPYNPANDPNAMKFPGM